MDKDYQKLLDSFASIGEKLKQIDAKKVTKTTTTTEDEKPGTKENEPDSDDVMSKMKSVADDLYGALRSTADYLHSRVNHVHDRVTQTNKDMDDHKKGHLPPIPGADKMSKACKALGIGDDYNIQKPTVWSHASKNKNTLEVDLSVKKK
jgi:CRISPR/Cas system CSM-associated protein Csm4 (group 5 of RAMP superfamily)